MDRRAILLLAASLPAAAESIDLASPEMIADGSALFAKNCAVGYCHGSEGRPARGPALRDRVWDPHELHRITVEGLPGTSMPGWKDLLSAREVWSLTAYVLSLSSEPPSGSEAIIALEAAEDAGEPVPLSAEAARGKALFFDLTRQRRCGVCHELEGAGTAVGPNLALAARTKTRQELTRDILKPQARIAYGFEQVQLQLRSGERIAGLLADESESQISVYDAASVPLPLRAVARRDIRSQRTRQRSSMPGDLDDVYGPEEIAAIVAYLSELNR